MGSQCPERIMGKSRDEPVCPGYCFRLSVPMLQPSSLLQVEIFTEISWTIWGWGNCGWRSSEEFDVVLEQCEACVSVWQLSVLSLSTHLSFSIFSSAFAIAPFSFPFFLDFSFSLSLLHLLLLSSHSIPLCLPSLPNLFLSVPKPLWLLTQCQPLSHASMITLLPPP